MRNRRLIAVLALAFLTAGFLTACDDTATPPKSQASESQVRQTSYDALVAKQPAHGMEYSPTRKSINFWIDTWKQPHKLSYVYMIASNGQLIGYYVFEGLPVTYCAALTPNYEKTGVDLGEYGGQAIVPAPGVDGAYYSGGQCNQYYGKDASTGQYIEYYAGQGISPLVYSEPLPRQQVQPLGFTTIEQAKALKK